MHAERGGVGNTSGAGSSAAASPGPGQAGTARTAGIPPSSPQRHQRTRAPTRAPPSPTTLPPPIGTGEVSATIQQYDRGTGYVAGTMEARDVPEAPAPVTTFFEGEIVDNVSSGAACLACYCCLAAGRRAAGVGQASRVRGELTMLCRQAELLNHFTLLHPPPSVTLACPRPHLSHPPRSTTPSSLPTGTLAATPTSRTGAASTRSRACTPRWCYTPGAAPVSACESACVDMPSWGGRAFVTRRGRERRRQRPHVLDRVLTRSPFPFPAWAQPWARTPMCTCAGRSSSLCGAASRGSPSRAFTTSACAGACGLGCVVVLLSSCRALRFRCLRLCTGGPRCCRPGPPPPPADRRPLLPPVRACRATGAVDGMYFDPLSSPDQKLSLTAVRAGPAGFSFPAFELA